MWTTLRNEKELDSETCGDEREMSMIAPRFLFGRLRGQVPLLEMEDEEVKVEGSGHRSCANSIGVSKSGPRQGLKK